MQADRSVDLARVTLQLLALGALIERCGVGYWLPRLDDLLRHMLYTNFNF